MTHVVMFSFGIGSWATAKIVAQRHGTENLILLNADTKYEDEDTYAWGEAAAKNVGGKLIRLCDGRDIWQVFSDERYLGNSRVDPCSKILKRSQIDRFMVQNYRPDNCVRYVGIHWSESERLDRIRKRLPEWNIQSPLCDPPLIAAQELHDWAEQEGLWKQRLYQFGFPHANCGGRCIKQGQSGWAHLLRVMPERYRECEEREFREHIGKDVSILRDRTGGNSKPLTLRDFRMRIEAGQECSLLEWGGCGCFAGEDDASLEW